MHNCLGIILTELLNNVVHWFTLVKEEIKIISTVNQIVKLLVQVIA